MTPVEKKIYSTINEQVYNRIKHNILSEVFPPGYHFQEKKLATTLGVSRSPVREALKRLSAEGLTEEMPHKGVIVKRVTEQEVREIFEFRTILERAALKNAVKKLNDEAVEKLNFFCEQLKKFHETHNVIQYSKFDTAFHDYLFYLWGNETIYKIWQNSFAQLQPLRLRSLQDIPRFDQSLQEHLGMVEGLINRDFRTAWKWNKIHLALARDAVLKYVKTQEN